MRFLKGYYNLISYAKSKETHRSNSNEYFEMHHIIPVSFGGDSSVDNLVKLTPKEHYIAHYLLTKFTKGRLYKKAIFAFDFMNKNNKNQNRKINAALYKKNKLKMYR